MRKQPKYLPTLEEIKRETAIIRKGWNEEMELQRSHGCTGGGGGTYKKEPYTIPAYRFHTTRADGLVAERLE